MLDHAFGRPSQTWRRLEVLLTILLALKLLRCKQLPKTSWLQRLDERLSRYRPWKIVLGTATAYYFMRNLLILVGLTPPESMSRIYTRSFFRVTWISTALDAGFWTAMPIKWSFLRHPLSILFTFYYLLNPEEAEYKTQKYHLKSTSEIMRVAWEKGTTPILSFLGNLSRPSIRTLREVRLPRPLPCSRSLFKSPPAGALGADATCSAGSLPDIKAWLFYDGTDEELARCSQLIMLFPGGGFVTMSPLDHKDHTVYWAAATKLPILSVDYGKAPQYPYPWGLEECFDAYRTVVESNGTVIGVNLHNEETPLQVVLAGDSAGGNFVFGVTLKILETQVVGNAYAPVKFPLPSPCGIMAVYPCLSFDMSCWISPNYIKLMKEGSTRHVHRMMEDRETLSQKNPLAQPPAPRKTTHILDSDDMEADGVSSLGSSSRSWSWSKWLPKDRRKEQYEKERGSVVHSSISFSSRMTYSNDRILTLDSMRSMAILYLGDSPYPPNFQQDYYLSPIVAPDALLARFPPTVLICGEKDPLVDDTIFVAARLRDVKSKMRAEYIDYLQSFSPEKVPTELAFHMFQTHANHMVHVKILEGISHGFLNYLPFISERKELLSLTSGWLGRLFHMHPTHPEYSVECTVSDSYRQFTETMVARARDRGAIAGSTGPHPYEQAFASSEGGASTKTDFAEVAEIFGGLNSDTGSLPSLAFYGGGSLPQVSAPGSPFSIPSPAKFLNNILPEKVVQAASVAVGRRLSTYTPDFLLAGSRVENPSSIPSKEPMTPAGLDACGSTASTPDESPDETLNYRRKLSIKREASYSSLSAILAQSSSADGSMVHSMSNSLDQIMDQLDRRRQRLANNVFATSSVARSP